VSYLKIRRFCISAEAWRRADEFHKYLNKFMIFWRYLQPSGALSAQRSSGDRLQRSRLRTAIPSLDRRARHRAVRAKYATVTRLRFQARAAAPAVVEELAGVRRHLLGGTVAAAGASEDGFKVHREIRPGAAVRI
jgi:hypothetical protein